MLLRADTLEAIREGRISLAFRRWLRPTVRSGGTLLTAAGQLEIREVAEVDPEDLALPDAAAAGYASLEALRAELARREGGRCYRVVFGALRPDPRVALRQRTRLPPEELEHVLSRLRRMDVRSPDGPWTEATLRWIRRRPGVRAGDLCQELDQARDRFKANVRKLKALGLTESLPTGYRLSPRGIMILDALGPAEPSAEGIDGPPG